MNPLVSIVIPVYQVEDCLERCMKSVLGQRYDNLEIILVDDGSTDRCPQLCDDYARQYSNVTAVHRPNGGLASARLEGFRHASGEFILFLDSDDYVAADMVGKLVGTAVKTSADLVMCEYYVVNGTSLSRVALPYEKQELSSREEVVEQYIKPLIGHRNKMLNLPGFLWIRLLKRKLIQEGFFQSERIYFLEDHVFDLLYADGIGKISILKEPLYYYCYREQSLSNRYRKNKWQMYCNLFAFYSAYLSDRKIPRCEERLDSFLQSAFQASVDNAVLSGSYRSYLAELDQIASSEMMPYIRRAARITEMGGAQKLTYLLYALHFYRLLYRFRISRLRENHTI